MQKINIQEKLSTFSEKWTPKIIGELNNQYVKIAKVAGDFIWHEHQNEDELFLVIKGELTMEFKDRTEILTSGEMIIVPKGVLHRPRTKENEEVHILMFEPKSTLNTGEATNERTITKLDKI